MYIYVHVTHGFKRKRERQTSSPSKRQREREKEKEREREREKEKEKIKRKRKREREREREREKDLNLNEPHGRLEVFAGTPRCRGSRPSGSTRSADASHFTPGRGLQGVVGAAGHRTEPAEVRGQGSDKTRVASEAGGGHAGPGELRASRARGPGKGVV